MQQGSLFKKVKPIIDLFVYINSFFPKRLNKMFLVLFRNFPFSLGILIRYILFKNLAKSCGSNVVIYQAVIFDAPEMMEFGNNISINPFCYLAGEITIGNDVSIAHTTAIHSANHTWSDALLPIKYNPIVTERVIISDDVWIACNCVLLSGVHIGRRAIVAAGAIVTKSFGDNCIIAGNPAKIVKNI